ncbi:cowpox A-type inclusion protein [Vaccinia virus]|uniref:Cowpox A-type inclusion protein n=1 Tax=Vaccinia virus TaxID=10245 RepID=A0A0A7A5P2_VACCV|nr:cowpox A-type inclusion protein [Vaccinia virus]ALF36303.1 cowpox A-type inclusion protein [Vaccinia virus]QQA05194.1 cowpox A-type inclusion protein [Vaccinia virus]QQA05412.1 cowpox A-type inclusion protein [Vaccinia virus]QQA05632.1 cowpox A-type inclusion protein [Vaccinia virus]
METIKALEKFMEFDRLQKDCADKLDRERERRMKAEREIARKNCGGNPCEREEVGISTRCGERKS